jgi:2'-5' RNA ligase
MPIGKMRCFLAIEIPEEVKKEIIRLGKEFNFLGKYVEKENLHLTLKFFGDVEDKKVGEIKEKLKKVKFKSFLSILGGMGFFPSEKMIRVLWVGIEPKEKLNKLYEEIEKSLGNKTEKFEAHVTLARIKDIKDKKEFLDRIKKIKIKPIEFEVREFVLKKSTLTPKGPIYEDVERFKLD